MTNFNRTLLEARLYKDKLQVQKIEAIRNNEGWGFIKKLDMDIRELDECLTLYINEAGYGG